jgi:hypothetical protein
LDDEMGHVDRVERVKVAPAVLAEFDAAFRASGPSRALYEKYLPKLGSGAIFDYLEGRTALCHGEAHDLGRALYGLRRDVGSALRECGARCTSACMHGVVGEAFGRSEPAAIVASMNGFCASPDMAGYKPGNCAHGIGHALMFTSGDDLDAALNACLYFAKPGMRYYCATGAFMEIMPKRQPGTRAQLHAPCSSYPGFAAACYRYRGPSMLGELGGDHEAFIRECQLQQGPTRLGCFHGLGSALTVEVLSDPSVLGRVCGRGNADEQVMCIEGAIERLGNADEKRAVAICSTLDGKAKGACLAAATGKTYRLDKPSMPLYHDAALVTQRKPLVGAR